MPHCMPAPVGMLGGCSLGLQLQRCCCAQPARRRTPPWRPRTTASPALQGDAHVCTHPGSPVRARPLVRPVQHNLLVPPPRLPGVVLERGGRADRWAGGAGCASCGCRALRARAPPPPALEARTADAAPPCRPCALQATCPSHCLSPWPPWSSPTCTRPPRKRRTARPCRRGAAPAPAAPPPLRIARPATGGAVPCSAPAHCCSLSHLLPRFNCRSSAAASPGLRPACLLRSSGAIGS